MMENRISYDDERKLTNAIESAATLACNDPARDRNETLVGQLKEAGVDSRFAKVAAAAFNKRLTVLTFKKTADEHKADPFELADADKVHELMTGESLEKAASLAAPFEITYSENTLQKAASAEEKPSRLPYEDTVRYEALVRHVESVMEKNAAALQDIVYAQDESSRKADFLSTELADYFMKNASASFEFDTLVNAYGDRFQQAIGSKLPDTTDYTRTAGGAILPDTPLFQKAAAMVEAHEASESLKQSLAYYGEGLSQFCKAAEFMGDVMQYAEMHKEAAEGWRIAAETAVDTPSYLFSGIPGAVDIGDSLVRGVGNTAGNAFQNAYALYQAGNAAHMAPNEILDAEFLTKDRYRDRLLGWSDMTADPQFSMYPAEQVFLATQKAMDMDTTLERPDRREVLRAYVAQMLAQNNRMSTADIAALAQTLRGLTSADEHGAQQIAVKSVKGLDEKRAPELPNLKPMLEGIKEIPGGAYQKTVDEIERSIKEYGEGREKRQNAEKASEDSASKAQIEKDRNRASIQSARSKFLHDVMNIQLRMNPSTGEVRYIQNTGRNGTPRTYTQDQIDQILHRAEVANLVPALPA